MNVRHKIVRLIGLAGMTLASAIAASSSANACEINRAVKLADSNWDTIQVFDSVAKIILEKGYGCKVDLVTADMVPLMTALSGGDVDVFFDFWILNNQELWNKAKAKGAVDLGVNYADSTQGWYVPHYVVAGDSKRGIKPAAPDLKTVFDLKKYKLVFKDPEQPDKGRFLNCPIGWGCEQVNNKKLVDYGLASSFVNFKPGSGAALDAAFVSAYKQGAPVVGYYWAPTWMLGVYDMVKLEEPACGTVAAGKSCAFPAIPSHTIASGKFVKEAPGLTKFFTNIKTTSALVSSMLAYLKQHDGSTSDDSARAFLKQHQDVWTKWVPADVAAKVKAAL